MCVCMYRTELTPENPLWVGAWWIGFLAGGAAALLIALPILGYPRQLPGNCPSAKLLYLSLNIEEVKTIQFNSIQFYLYSANS